MEETLKVTNEDIQRWLLFMATELNDKQQQQFLDYLKELANEEN